MKTTKLNLQDTLPLTCTRAGTCCHGNRVMLNPWELFCLAKEKSISPKEFRNRYTEFGGIKLLFNGTTDNRGKNACSQYIKGFGCSVHNGRPLACRLFPIGRQIQHTEAQYIFEGNTFPCLEGCSDVIKLPKLTVENYLKGQETEQYEKGQDEYLELVQDLADIAFEMLLETGLAQSSKTKTLTLWLEMGNEAPELLVKRIGQEWMDCLMIPEILDEISGSLTFVKSHSSLLHKKAQEKFAYLAINESFSEASVTFMGLALHLARAIGANPEGLAKHWCQSAKEFGALDS